MGVLKKLNGVLTKSVFSYTNRMTSWRLNALKFEQPYLIIKVDSTNNVIIASRNLLSHITYKFFESTSSIKKQDRNNQSHQISGLKL